MSRQQVIDILERNVSLYREDEAFVHYMVELAMYLLEYEYDWGKNGHTPDFNGPRANVEAPRMPAAADPPAPPTPKPEAASPPEAKPQPQPQRRGGLVPPPPPRSRPESEPLRSVARNATPPPRQPTPAREEPMRPADPKTQPTRKMTQDPAPDEPAAPPSPSPKHGGMRIQQEFAWGAQRDTKPPISQREKANPEKASLRDRLVTSKSSGTAVKKDDDRRCPYCGTVVGKRLMCPSCKNIAR